MSLFRLAVFRSLFVATLASNVGSWMEDVGETWLMTSFGVSPLTIALVQTSASLPVFILALPAGTLADIVERRTLLLTTQAWLLVVAAGLGALTVTHHLGASGLLACTFAMGVGSALAGPAWEASVGDIVPRSEVGRATMLNGISFNVGRVAGPALGGLAVARLGPAFTFFFNAATFVGVLFVLARWRTRRRPTLLPTERVWTGVRTGLRYVREALSLRAVLLRTFGVLVFASAFWALLPSFVNRVTRGSSLEYGALLAAVGAGALFGAWLVSRASRRAGVDAVLVPATLLLAVGIAWLAAAPSIAWALGAAFVVGAAWLPLLTTSMTAAQKASAEWVRARALAVFILAVEGATTLGSVAFGWLATHTSVRLALGAAAAGTAASALLALVRPLRDLDRYDRAPAELYPIPAAPPHVDREHTPVVVEIEYRVPERERSAFRVAMQSLGRSRRRTGAAFWILTHDSAEPSRFVELFLIESWNEHHRQHARWTKHDESVWRHVRSLVEPGSEPRVAHLLADTRAPRAGA